jgi:hypothetical protein
MLAELDRVVSELARREGGVGLELAGEGARHLRA